MKDEKLQLLLDFVNADGRICPDSQEWKALWEMLPDEKWIGSGWEPPSSKLKVNTHLRISSTAQLISKKKVARTSTLAAGFVMMIN